MKRLGSKFSQATILGFLGVIIGACAKPALPPEQVKYPGVVEYVWEEPMVDVIEVPPGLDPEGHYYRPAHREVVEIRQGRWRYHGDPK